MDIIKLKNVSKYYYNKQSISSGFTKVNLSLSIGEFVVITGESGSGKSTLLNVISGLDSYEDGEMYIEGKETSHYREEDYEVYRRKYIGNIFQNFNLVNSYTVYQNVELVLLLNGEKKKNIRKRILDVIETVGLSKYKNTKASKLSGGQKQRVAIARALVKDTPIIVADEPTGNLDVASAKSVMELLHNISKEKLVIIVTHNYEQVKDYTTRKITMSDGRIIEDKKLKPTENTEAKVINFKDITLFNKLLLAFRNTFNIKVKFLLLLLVYFFLTIFVFSGYSSITKMNDEQGLFGGINNYFNDTSSSRIIINKQDKSTFTEEDFDKINKLNNIDYIIKDDTFTDSDIFIEDDSYFFNCNLRSIEPIEKVTLGRLPENDKEVVLQGSKSDITLKEALNRDMVLTFMNSTINNDIKVKVVGIIYKDSEDNSKSTLYTSDTIISEARRLNNIEYSRLEIYLDWNLIKNGERTTFVLTPNNKVPIGQIYISPMFNEFCINENCKNKNLNLKIKNTYYEDSLDLKISNIYDENNSNRLLGIDKNTYQELNNDVFINPEDYNKLYNKGIYQSSIYIKNVKKLNNTEKELNKLGFNTYPMKKMVLDLNKELKGILKLFRIVVFIISIVILFFISYFIIKIILKSRNTYYSTIRILGAKRQVTNTLLTLELLNDINIAYLLFISLVVFTKTNIIKIKYIKDLTTYFKISDYILVYLILIIMSVLITNRYARKIFKKSALETYRNEAI